MDWPRTRHQDCLWGRLAPRAGDARDAGDTRNTQPHMQCLEPSPNSSSHDRVSGDDVPKALDRQDARGRRRQPSAGGKA